MSSSPIFCKVCNNQRFKSESAYQQHVRDSTSHRERLRQQVVCTACGGKIFKDAAAYNNHATQNKEHLARVGCAAAVPSTSAASTSATPRASVLLPGTSAPGIGAAAAFSRASLPPSISSRPVSVASFATTTIHSPAVTRPGSSATFTPRVTPAAVLRSDTPPSVRAFRQLSAASNDLPRVAAMDVSATLPKCPICGDPVSYTTLYQHAFDKHPEVCCEKCSTVFRSSSILQQHWKDSDAHPSCEYCPEAFPDSGSHYAHVSQAHSGTHAQQHDSLYEVVYAHISAPPLRESYSQDSSSDHSFRAPSPLSSCDLSDVPDQPDVSRSALHTEACETPKSDVPGLQRGLVVDITPASEPARAASEPPPSAVAPSKSNSMFDEPAVDLAASTQSIRSQAAPVPSTTGDVAGANQEMGSPRRRSSSPDARAPSNTASTWSVVSSPRSSTRYHSVERHASSPEPRPTEEPHPAEESRPVEDQEPRPARAVPVQPTGGTVASEGSSGLDARTPVSARSLIFTLNEQIGAQRAQREAVQAKAEEKAEEPLLGSRGSSTRATPVLSQAVLPRVRTPKPEQLLGADSARGTVQEDRQTLRSRSVSRTRTSYSTRPTYSSYEAAPTSETQIDASALPGSHTSASADTFQTPKPRLQWHCRVCLRPPTDPTVTMCGHLFCHQCIVAEMAKNLQCPVCRTVMLVRLDVVASC